MEAERNIDRRKFLKLSGLGGAALAIGFHLPSHSKNSLASPVDCALYNLSSALDTGIELNTYIIIPKVGKITLINPRPDMGQGSFQAVPSLLAEELEVSLEQVDIRQSDGSKKYGNQLSGGSGSVRTSWEPLRMAGAAAKEMLIKAASAKWKVDASECYAKEGRVFNKTGDRSFTYGELVEEASKLEIPKTPKLKEPKDFKILGKQKGRPDVPLKTNGSAIFGLDVKIPGMLYASLERSPVIYGKILKFDDSEAKKVKGVKHVLKAERPMLHATTDAIAVLADSYYAALQGRKALKITWDEGEYSTGSTDAFFKSMEELSKKEGIKHDEKGEFNTNFQKASKKLESTYSTPFLAHAPMEPENAIAHVKEDSCEVWAPVQAPDWAVNSISAYLKIAPEKVKVNVTFLGGAFGRKAYYDYLLEAVHLSKQIKAPVKVIWSREDDTSQGPFRPALLSAMKGGIDENGNVVAFEHKIVSPSIQQQTFKSLKEGAADEWAMEAIGEKDSPYAFPNKRLSFTLAQTTLPIVWWRSVYASSNIFGHESFIDELAHASGKDPLQFRIEMMKESPRHLNVLKVLQEKSGYKSKLAGGKAMGVAIARSFESICAHAITVSKGNNGITIEKVVSVIDCGMFVNPDNVRAQTEGNIVMGITAAVKDGITVVDGKVQQTNFHNYKVLRINEVPLMEIHIIQNTEKPGGVGEPGLPAVAPALTNAVFNLIGKRIKTLPFNLAEV
jgi:isoquinoline 1-oxidoreductase beta subunit